MNKDYYAILGVTSRASQEEIRLAYEKMMAQPDPLSQLLDRKVEIEEAYFVLSNPTTRSQYDRIYNNTFSLARNFDGFDNSKFSQDGLIGMEAIASPTSLKNLTEGLDLDIDFEDAEGMLPENFTEIFQVAIKNIINATNRFKIIQKQEKYLKNGVDIFLDLPLNSQKAEKGGYLPLDYERYIYCSQCQKKDDLLLDRCPKCDGAGRVMAHRRVEIKIPKNSADGAVLQIVNEGHAGDPGSSNGDLFIKIIIRDEV